MANWVKTSTVSQVHTTVVKIHKHQGWRVTFDEQNGVERSVLVSTYLERWLNTLLNATQHHFHGQTDITRRNTLTNAACMGRQPTATVLWSRCIPAHVYCFDCRWNQEGVYSPAPDFNHLQHGQRYEVVPNDV